MATNKLTTGLPLIVLLTFAAASFWIIDIYREFIKEQTAIEDLFDDLANANQYTLRARQTIARINHIEIDLYNGRT